MTHELPAILGGTAVRPQGPPDWPVPDDDVLQALQACYRDGSWGKYQGGHVERLEQRLASYLGIAHVLACASGTFAVELALRALPVGPGDEVLLAGYDYPGNFLCVHAVGARPVLVDIAPENWNLAPERVADAVGPATRAILVSHLHGGLAPMRELRTVADDFRLRLLEDAAQVPGACVQGRQAGTWGDAGILSFGGSKLLGAGRGGALLTNHPDVYQRARSCLFRGNLFAPLSELQAAVLLPQLDKLDDRNAWRARQVQRLRTLLLDLPGLRFFTQHPTDRPAYYKLGLQFDAPQFGLTRAGFLAAVRAEGIALDEGFRALHVGRSPSRFRAADHLAVAELAHAGAVVLHHPILLGSDADVREVAQAIRKVHAHAARLSTSTRP